MLSLALTAAAALAPLQVTPAPVAARDTVAPPSGAAAAPTAAPVRADAGDPDARALLARARAARLTQDAALTAYDAHTYQRFSVGLGTSVFSRERLLLRTEAAAHVTWSRAAGVTIEQTGNRAVVPIASGGTVHADLVDATPIPYFPGRETLWFPSPAFGVARADVDPTSFIHPLANGSEAYYRYALGESSGLRLPNGRSIGLRELRVTPRRPSPRAFVGSFWFDTASGHVVRAVYRMSVDFDLWAAANQDVRRRLDSLQQAAARDTVGADAEERRRRRARVERSIEEEKPPRWFTFATGQVRATISAVTVEYGLFEGRVWLPRRSVAEGEARSGFVRMPVTLEERYRYDGVSVSPEAVPVGTVASVAAAPVTPAGAPSSTSRIASPNAPSPVPLASLRTALDSALALAPIDSGARGEISDRRLDARRTSRARAADGGRSRPRPRAGGLPAPCMGAGAGRPHATCGLAHGARRLDERPTTARRSAAAPSAGVRARAARVSMRRRRHLLRRRHPAPR